MSKLKNPKISIGIVSLTVIFSVLCLTIFSVLTLSTAVTELHFSQKRAAAQQSYYAAEQECAQIANTIGQLWETSNEAALFSYLDTQSISYTTNNDTLLLSYEKPIDSGQILAVELQLGTEFHITRWQIVSTQDWVPDTDLPVWDGNTNFE